MAALLRSKVLISSNGKVLACQISLNDDSFLNLNSLSLLVEVPRFIEGTSSNPSHPISISFTVRHQNSNSSKKTPSQVVAAEWSGEFRADQRRRVRLESAVVWEQRVLIILAHNFASLISFFIMN